MSIEDNQPERRNLVVMSMSIIAFYIGGGQINGADGLELPLIKLHFNNPHYLGYLAWVTLLWFALRYYVENKYKIFNLTLGILQNSTFMFHKIVPTAFGIKTTKATFNEIDQKSSKWYIRYHNSNDNFAKLEISLGIIDGNSKFEDTKNFVSVLMWFILTVRFFLSAPSISAYTGPLVIFFIAILFGIWNEIILPYI